MGILLLESHLEHSNMHMMYYDDKEGEEGLRCPFFRLPKSKQYTTVLLKDYVTLSKQQFLHSCKTKDDEDVQWTISHAFELLYLLYALDNDNQYLNTHSNKNPKTTAITSLILTKPPQQQRYQNEAFYSWLHKSLSTDANQEIQKSLNDKNKDDVYDAIFTAYISGNL